MKTILGLILLIFTLEALSFNMTDNKFYRFGQPDNIVINVASDGCSASGGYTADELLRMAVHGAELYWNTVETANVRFVRGRVVSGLTANGKDLSAFYVSTGNEPWNQVYIGCSSAVPSTAAAYSTTRGTDKNMKGLVLFKDSASNFGRDYDTTSAVLAHELGHNLGLGHSRYRLALMDSSGGALGLNKLSQDDRDGVTYLYPHDKELGGCLGSFGTIDLLDNDKRPPGPFLFSLCLGFLFIFGVRMLKGKSLEFLG